MKKEIEKIKKILEEHEKRISRIEDVIFKKDVKINVNKLRMKVTAIGIILSRYWLDA